MASFLKTQWALGAVFAAMMSAGLYSSMVYANDTLGNTAQRLTTRQVATLLSRHHYLDQKLDERMGQKILDEYLIALDPNRQLFLKSDIDEIKARHGKTFARALKLGDLSIAADIYARYLKRQTAYFDFARDFLAKEVPLHSERTIVIDREDLPWFNADEQKAYWADQLTSQLIGITLSQEDDKAKDEVFSKSEASLVRADKRTPKQVLLQRIERAAEQLGRKKSDEVMETVLNTAMQTYDPHSNYYAPVQATEMNIQSNLELEGIGISIRPDRKNPDYMRIVSLVDGGPAAKSGQVRAGDLILAVAQDDGVWVDTTGYNTREIVALIRGKRGTNVSIRLKQPNSPDSSARVVSLVRDVIAQEESGVRHRVIEVDGARVGVLEIPSFYLNFKAKRDGGSYRSVSDDTQNALVELNAQGIDKLVVDLRGNPGGSLDEVAKMLGLFIKQGPVVQIQDNQGNVRVYDDEDGGEQLYQGDMVVITNLASASASEIFAAAIQDYGRGLVVGSTTTGKGSAQVQLDELALGQANLTQRKFYRITGGSTQNKGVVPDINLVNIYEGATFGEREYKNALPWDTIASTQFVKETGRISPDLSAIAERSKARQRTEPNFVFLSTINTIRAKSDDKKPIAIDIDKRRAKAASIEQETLTAENKRRQALGLAPHADWASYQAYLESEGEKLAAMSEAKRPKLPEDEAFVIEAARIMLDNTHALHGALKN